ncbi:Guanylate cyclase soluble subunit alpha-2 [Galemys pyrenaicus]|uniref:guanylate cyclase n=1 Tax=Galemys pyrenaicus TaxID=202257 RepID=A0A8J6AL65_GALPY|nr:Guanylate cyclase soluble subunit alpha-2 [Galemys pyrenaicus]
MDQAPSGTCERQCVTQDPEVQVMEVKGQMIHVPESNSVLFLGSPCVDKLDELMGRGLHLSDIPIHDATRDVILVGEQAKAQDGLKKRMDKLKATLERTHQALEEEKKKTVDLLYSIFPGDVAQQLWQGQQVQARKFDDVTMLFSDIVGFTAICAQCTPMQVISMLNELYTRFDHQCGFLDIYKVETIGDAYCVAAGLHRKSLCHAKPIALMALKMMELSEEVLTPDGRPIQLWTSHVPKEDDGNAVLCISAYDRKNNSPVTLLVSTAYDIRTNLLSASVLSQNNIFKLTSNEIMSHYKIIACHILD